MEESNLGEETELIEPFPIPVFGLELLEITRNQRTEDSNTSSDIEDYS